MRLRNVRFKISEGERERDGRRCYKGSRTRKDILNRSKLRHGAVNSTFGSETVRLRFESQSADAKFFVKYNAV